MLYKCTGYYDSTVKILDVNGNDKLVSVVGKEGPCRCAGDELLAGRIPVETGSRGGWGLMGSGCGLPHYQWRRSDGSSGHKMQQTCPGQPSVQGHYTH